jgi:hypothetical protein
MTAVYPHRIRLRGPWEVEGTDPVFAGRVTLPARLGEIGLGDARGRVHFRRRFGLPRRLDDWERVWLTCAGVTGSAAWFLSGVTLAPAESPNGSLECEVTALLRDRNELAVELDVAGPGGGLWGEVALEIRCRAYLRRVVARSSRRGEQSVIVVRGEVVRDQPSDHLELYALVDGTQAGYRLCPADQAVTGFEFVIPAGGLSAGREMTVRVDLVNVATIWYTVEQVVSAPE